MSGPLLAPERVLATLNADGTRRTIRPKLATGRWYKARLVVAWSLIAIFALIPFLRMNGKPLILLDIPARMFTVLGRTFLATDGVILMLFLLSAFVFVIWGTALVGRAWCGWGCPQTVYLEFVFRPIERWLEGGRTAQIRIDRAGNLNARRILKYVVFVGLSLLVGNIFLAYFVGVDRLADWVTRPPSQHPAGFAVMAITAGLVMFDFAYFRDQMCTVVCPYARLQSVLLDRRSLLVGYDAARGEPREKGKPRSDRGDCIDCSACVYACPTGIDIRDGLQMECIACAQCVDACDRIMDRIKKPRGLIRYSSEDSLETGTKSRILRTRVAIYTALLAGFVIALFVATSRIGDADVTVLRGIGAPFVVDASGVRNQLRIKIENRSDASRDFAIQIDNDPELKQIAPENPLPVRAGTHQTTSVFVIAPRTAFKGGIHPLKLRITDGNGITRDVSYKLLGPTETRDE